MKTEIELEMEKEMEMEPGNLVPATRAPAWGIPSKLYGRYCVGVSVLCAV